MSEDSLFLRGQTDDVRSGQQPAILVVMGDVGGFPNGFGAVARVRCYATGLRDVGARVHVVVLEVGRPGSPEQVHNIDARGAWNGIPYEYACGSAQGARSFVGRRLRELRGLHRLWTLARNSSRHGNLRSIVFYGGTKSRWLLPVRRICSATGIALVQDISEYPFVYDRRRGLIRRVSEWLYWRVALRLPDGIVAISTLLEESLSGFTRADSWILRVPIMVDIDRFIVSGEAIPGAVAYAGDLSHLEELRDLIGAVALLAHDDSEITLRIIGSGTTAETEWIRRQVDEQGLTGRTHLVGTMSADALPGELRKASVLVLARKDGLFSRAGMPTKIGEYLATGRPVVVTATGDIPLYLKDGVDCYLVPPGDVQLLAAAIDRALHDPDAASVGSAGRETAARCFDPATHMSRLLGLVTRPRDRETRGVT